MQAGGAQGAPRTAQYRRGEESERTVRYANGDKPVRVANTSRTREESGRPSWQQRPSRGERGHTQPARYRRGGVMHEEVMEDGGFYEEGGVFESSFDEGEVIYEDGPHGHYEEECEECGGHHGHGGHLYEDIYGGSGCGSGGCFGGCFGGCSGGCAGGCSDCDDGYGMEYGGHDDLCFGQEDGCSYCGGCEGGCDACMGHRKPIFIQEAALFAGATAFKGPLDQGLNGNFGFQEGVQIAGRLKREFALGFQAGGRFTQTDLSGTIIADDNTIVRTQSFVTAGLFRRNPCGCGFQYGVVFDYLNDNYYVDLSLNQVRAEISYLGRNRHEIGFWGAFHTNDDTVLLDGETRTVFRAVDQYNLFYRYNFCNGGNARFWGGGTGSRGGILGAEVLMPLTNRMQLHSGFTYLIPEGSQGLEGASQEGWALSMTLIWFPGRTFQGTHNGQYRQLFSVADNTTFLVEPVRE